MEAPVDVLGQKLLHSFHVSGVYGLIEAQHHPPVLLRRRRRLVRRLLDLCNAFAGEVSQLRRRRRKKKRRRRRRERNDASDWECINDTTIIFRNSLAERSVVPTAYSFDRVFRCERTTKQVYEEGAKEVALSVVNGINSSIFAYGQTSSGKTYTMNGITEYTVTDIYEYIKRHEERAFVLKFSAMEIYNEAVRDLLSMENTPLRVLDDPERGTIVERLTEETLRDWNHLKQLISVCEAQRQIGETLLNEMSSRSHQILRLTVESSACESLGKDNSSTLVASVNFVDLAGSERASLALSSGTRLKEGCHINRSLLTLGTVIRKLSKGRNGHVPYRDSKLTRILHSSLGGNARTAIICTICPARSHIEQSRNTLLFASCAKEVVTSARVNVVMSDKALVKHLQKELARLESEMRYPASASTCHLELLLREKDALMKKMAKEITELRQERDLAHSRLENLLQLVGGDRSTRQWEETSQISISSVPNGYKDAFSTSKSSTASNHGVDFGSTKFHSSLGSSNHMEYTHHSEKSRNQDMHSPRHSISSSRFYGLDSHLGDEESVQDTHDNFDDHCKEVQCIEVDQPIKDENPNVAENSSSTRHGHHEPESIGEVNTGPSNANPTYITLEQHLQNVRKTLDSLGKTNSNETSPRSRSLALSRSRSCRDQLMNNSSLLAIEAGQNESTPPCSSRRDFPRRPAASRRRRFALTFEAQTEIPSVEGSDITEESTINASYRPHIADASSKGDVTSISDFVTELKEMAQDHFQKQLTDGQADQNAGLDLIVGPIETPSHWPLEFEKQQREIIELWHECNVSLVHRTYFFLLFKGDPTDSIYVEVELRRLSFLKRTLSCGNHGKAMTDGQDAVLTASLKNLRRERVMLCRQMQKRLSPDERECLYQKWEIALDSKQRRLQLARRLWTNPSDIGHIRESALTVAKIVGFLERGEALKEMFGLSFTPQKPNQKSYSWKLGIPSLK